MSRIVSLILIILSTLPILASAEAQSRDPEMMVFRFLAGSEEVVGGGGGIVVRRSDTTQCEESLSAAPGGIVDASYECKNSDGAALRGSAAQYTYQLIDSTPQNHSSVLGGVVNVRTGRITCVEKSIAAPGGPVETTYSCAKE